MTIIPPFIKMYEDAMNSCSSSDTLDFIIENIFEESAKFIRVAYYDDELKEWCPISDHTTLEQHKIYEEQTTLGDNYSEKIKMHMWTVNDYNHNVCISLSQQADMYDIEHSLIVDQVHKDRKATRDIRGVIEVLKSLPSYKNKVQKLKQD